MKRKKTVNRDVVEIDAIICNKCGKQTPSDSYGGALVDAEVSGGYNSQSMEDGARYSFDLCEACVVELMKTFKHSAFLFCLCGDEHHFCQSETLRELRAEDAKKENEN